MAAGEVMVVTESWMWKLPAHRIFVHLSSATPFGAFLEGWVSSILNPYGGTARPAIHRLEPQIG